MSACPSLPPLFHNHSHPAASPRGCLAALKCRACLCMTAVWQKGWGSTFLKGWVVRGPGVEGKHRHNLLPTSCFLDRSISPGSLCPLSLYLQGEGGVQAGGDGEDFCQVNDSTRVAQDLRRVGAGGMAVSRIRCFL